MHQLGYEVGKEVLEALQHKFPSGVVSRVNPVVAGVLGAVMLPAAFGTAVTAPIVAYTGRKDVHFATAKAKARKMNKLEDEELRALLRGLSVVKEETKRTEHYIKE
jgi:hypothetical protein